MFVCHTYYKYETINERHLWIEKMKNLIRKYDQQNKFDILEKQCFYDCLVCFLIINDTEFWTKVSDFNGLSMRNKPLSQVNIRQT